MHVLRNQMETIVRQHLAELLPQMEVCTCEKCQLDIQALVLNSLPSHYVVTEKGEMMTSIDQTLPQNQADLYAAITKACVLVGSNPQHDLN